MGGRDKPWLPKDRVDEVFVHIKNSLYDIFQSRHLLMLVAETYKLFAFQLSINMEKFKTWLDEKEAEQKN